MPVIGNPTRFAIEYSLNDNHGGEWMFGRFCYWCGGRRVGEYAMGTSLRDILFQIEHFSRDKGFRYSRRFSAMAAADVFRLIDCALFGPGEPKTDKIADEEQWARHNIFPQVDLFDRWKGYLVECRQFARIIFAREPYSHLNEVIVDPGEVDAVIETARKELRVIYERESHPASP